MSKAVYWQDKGAEHGYRKAFAHDNDVDFFLSNGAYLKPSEFPVRKKPGRKPKEA